MAERIAISESELLEAIATAGVGAGPEEARTVAELCDTIGTGHLRVRKGLHLLKKAGRLQVHRVLREGLDGRLSTVAAYTISPP
jgi:DNA-binding transcriptional regulator PaaX